jgi:hypothetical protein
MPDKDFHLVDHARSRSHDSRFRGNDKSEPREFFIEFLRQDTLESPTMSRASLALIENCTSVDKPPYLQDDHCNP